MFRHAIAGILGIVFVASSASAENPADRAKCDSVYEQAQYLRKDHKLTAAHEQLVSCLQLECPAFISTDCAQWLPQVEAAQPSLVFAVRRHDGAEVSNANVFLDGAKVDATRGDSVIVDPGSHTVRFEIPGEAPIERTVVIREGEKNHLVDVTLKPPVVAPVAPPPSSGPSLAPAFVVGGIALAALGAAGALTLVATNRYDSLESSCGPRCSESDVSSLRTMYVSIDVALGVGIAGAITSAILFAVLSKSPAKQGLVTRPWAVAGAGGLSLSW